MHGYFKRIIEKIIDWGVPVVCAAALLIWKEIPNDLHHYWPVICIAVMGIYSLIMSIQTRRDVRSLHRIHKQADEKAAEKQARDDSIAKAFRAMLDDDMGKLYISCLEKGYTTEDERRRYDRLDKAYHELDGNGEAARRKPLFLAIDHEEEYRVKRAHEQKG